jgi:tetratricopeptide (TPR) repeat protein
MERLPENEARQRSLIDLQLEMVWPLHFLGQQDRILEICKDAEALAQKLNDRLLMGKVLYEYALSYFFKNEYPQAEQYYLKILEQSDEKEMNELAESVKFPLAVVYISTGRLVKAATLYTEVIATREANGTQHEYLEELPFLPYTHSCHHLAYIRALHGDIETAKHLIKKGSTPEIMRISNLQSRSYCTLWHSSFSYLIGEDNGVMVRVNEALEIAEKTDSPIIRYLCYAAKGNAFMAVEEFEAARSFFEKALQAIKGTEHRRYLEEVGHNLIESVMIMGDLATAEQYYQEVTHMLKLNPDKAPPRFDALKGRLIAMSEPPDYARADALLQNSIDADETSGALVLAARTKFYRTDILARMGDIDAGRSLLCEIQKLFQKWGIPVWQRKCEQALH